MRRSTMPVTECISCGAEIRRDKPRVGASVICTECGELMEVVSTAPFELDFPTEDDWDDDDDIGDDEDW
jgi:lysine biosynthesis protein LysW